MSPDIKPTPEQFGYVMGVAIRNFPVAKLAARRDDALSRAGLSPSDYLSELFLLCTSAVVHTIRNAPMSLEAREAVEIGLKGKLAESHELASSFALSHLDNGFSYYSEAAAIDASQHNANSAELSEIEAAFGDRLLSRDAENEQRAGACLELCIVLPKTLWKAYVEMAETMLIEEGLVASQ